MSSSEEEDHDEPLCPIQQRSSSSPVPSCMSMKTDRSMGEPLHFKAGVTPADQSPIQQRSSSSPVPSCMSMKTDRSIGEPLHFKAGVTPADQSSKKKKQKRSHSPTPSVSMKSDKSIDQPITFKEEDSSTGQCQQIHKSHLQKKFQFMIEGLPQQGDSRLFRDIYINIYITEGGGGMVNDQHEVRQIVRESGREAAQDRSIKFSDLFKPVLEDERKRRDIISEPLDRQLKPIRTVLTKGVAGIGKTVSVQKFILDWTEGTGNQDIHFIFPLPFRELNLMKEKKLSLVDLIQHFFPEIKDPRIFTSSAHRVMFIFDGLDECRLPLDFYSYLKCCDVTEPASVDVLLINLIMGHLLPSALLWITTRPAAANQIPPECVDRVTEIRGFNDPQKDEYFKKRISDEDLAKRTITHLKSFRSLYIMCHIPVFCWISATVVVRTSEESESEDMPRTLTQMYTRFLFIQTSMKHVKYTERKETDEEVIFKLGKLAFQQLDKGNLIFYEEDLRECGIDVTEALVYSGVCTQIFREESGLNQGKVFSFVHLSIQEFLAALYVFLCFSKRHMPDEQDPSQLSALFRAATLHDLHKTAVELALKSLYGHLDLFLRFLLGLSLKSNQSLLKNLLPNSSSQSDSSEQTVQYVKQKIRDQKYYLGINLYYCLNELNHYAVVEVIDRRSGKLYINTLLLGVWQTKRFKFEMSEEQLAEFDLQEYIKIPGKDQTELLSPDDVLQKLVPVVTTSTSAELIDCKLTEKSCPHLVFALTAQSSSLGRLDLSHNELLDSGVDILCSALSHQNCKLEELKLIQCNLTDKSCSYLASALSSHPSSLRLLDLRANDLLDSGVELLCSALCHQNCKLEKLVLWNCELTDMSCSYLASALSTHSSNLRVLILEGNKEISKSAVEQFSALVEDPHCKLERLESNWGTIERSSIQTPTSVLSAECLGRNMSMSPASSSSRETASS